MVEPQIEELVRRIREVLGDDVVGIYLHGSAVLGGLKPHSDMRDTKTVEEYLGWDARNVVLTLARIWTAIATDRVHSKDSAAAWALARLPKEHRPVLKRARAVYLGEAEEQPWDAVLPQVRAYAAFVVSEIERAKQSAAVAPASSGTAASR